MGDAAVRDLADAVRSGLLKLGMSDADTSMGAIEALAKEVLDGSDRVALALNNIADAINHLADEVAKQV